MRKLRITIEGKAYDVTVEELDADAPVASASTAALPAPSAGGDKPVVSQIAGTVVRVEVSEGQSVNAGEPLVVLEAMKMNTTVTAPRAGTVSGIAVKAGDSVEEGRTLLNLA